MGQLLRIFKEKTALQEKPDITSAVGRRDSQLLFGEDFLSDKIENGWARGCSVLDGYEGWIRIEDARPEEAETTHAVKNFMTHIYPSATFRSRESLCLSFMSRVRVEEGSEDGGFVAIDAARSQWVPEEHLVPLDQLNAGTEDIVDTALMLKGCPYGYGGRSVTGLDCSAIVQLALQRHGYSCKRDSDQQMTSIGSAVDIDAAQRGDIVFFPGHTGIMVNETEIINATVRHMSTVVEPLSFLDEKYAGDGLRGILEVRRLG